MLEGIAAIFRRKVPFRVVGLASTADDAITLVERIRPNVLSLDLGLRGDAMSVVRHVGERWPETKIVIFTASESVDAAMAVLNAGARGYVLKGGTSEELANSLLAAARGDLYVSPAFAGRLISRLQLPVAAEGGHVSVRLSHREDQIIRLLKEGKRNREIAAALCLSEKTVKCYMTTLMQKLNARSRLEVIVALQDGHPLSERCEAFTRGIDRMQAPRPLN
jgi:DNA-binding NarL/FixJ family response regulator